LQSDKGLRFHSVNNEQIIGYSKQTEDLKDLMLMVVNLDPHYTQSGWIHLSLESLGLKPDKPYYLFDLLNDAQYTWWGEYNYVELNPHVTPAHIFVVRQ
jgi:starch synthase (maltosyl-transferring)